MSEEGADTPGSHAAPSQGSAGEDSAQSPRGGSPRRAQSNWDLALLKATQLLKEMDEGEGKPLPKVSRKELERQTLHKLTVMRDAVQAANGWRERAQEEVCAPPTGRCGRQKAR